MVNAGQEGRELEAQEVANLARSRRGYKTYEDTIFTAGDTNTELDILADLGENAHVGYILVDRSADATPQLGDLQVQIAEGDGSTYGDIVTIKNGVSFPLDGMDANKIKLIHTGTNCSYYVFVKKA